MKHAFASKGTCWVKQLVMAAMSSLAASGVAWAETTIVVDCGRFASALEAAGAEDRVNWLDADLSDDTACTESFAALELQRYLRKMTGRADDFAVASREPARRDLIRVGGADARTSAAQIGPEGYRIRSSGVNGRRVTSLCGGGRVGTLYAAYDLLYRLGCRWFAPGEVHEEVPRIVGIPDMDVTEKPSFVTRGFLAWENRGDVDFLLWMARNRLDYWTLAQEPHSLMHKLGIRMVCGRHDAENEFLGPYKPYPYDHARFTGDEGRPRDPYPLSPEYQGDADRDGRLSYFEAHPEWYAMVKGKRVPGIRENFGTNYCTANPHATAEFVKNYAQGLIDGPYREADIVRFWALDVGKWCECDACQAQGTPTDRYLLLVHRFCQELDKARANGRLHRPLEVTFLAYADVVDPPTRPLPAGFPPDYCMATFYPIRRCYVHRLDDPTCTAKNDQYCRQLAGWSHDPQRHYRGQLAIGEYYNVSVFKCLPVCFMHTMATDIPHYYRAGARTFDYMHVTCRNWGSRALTNYQMARQLWDVRTDCSALWQDYFVKRYGAAAETMRAFYESLEAMFSNVTELKYGLARRLDRGVADLFPNAQLRYRREPGLACDGPTLTEILDHGRQCRRLLTQAMAMTLPPRIQQRIAEDERNFTYGERTVAYYDACAQAFTEARGGRLDSARKHHAEAQRLAELLRADTISAKDSSSHASAEDALAASLASGALKHIAKLLEAR